MRAPSASYFDERYKSIAMLVASLPSAHLYVLWNFSTDNGGFCGVLYVGPLPHFLFS